jgi:hypothetical protein
MKFHHREKLRRRKRCQVLSTLPHLKGMPPLPTAPAAVDWGDTGLVAFPMDGNDQFGDCEYTAACHAVGAMTANVGREYVFDPGLVVQSYLTLAGGDYGLGTDTMMQAWKKGLCGTSHRIVDDMSIDPFDQHAMTTGCWLFGGLFFTLAVPDPWLNIGPGGLWDSGPGIVANPNNGHAVYISGYNGAGLQVETWGMKPPVLLTWSGLRCCDPEATVVWSEDWLSDAAEAPNHYMREQLATIWAQLGGTEIPSISRTSGATITIRVMGNVTAAQLVSVQQGNFLTVPQEKVISLS